MAQQQMFDLGNGGHAVCFNPGGRFHGWLFLRHPDGQYVSVRQLAEVDNPFGPPIDRPLRTCDVCGKQSAEPVGGKDGCPEYLGRSSDPPCDLGLDGPDGRYLEPRWAAKYAHDPAYAALAREYHEMVKKWG